MKHSTLIRNKGSVIYYHNGGGGGGGLLEFGGTPNFRRQKGENTKLFVLKRGEQKVFIKRIF